MCMFYADDQKNKSCNITLFHCHVSQPTLTAHEVCYPGVCVNTGIWLQQSSSSIFCMSASSRVNTCGRLQEVAAPATIDDIGTTNSVIISTFSASPDALYSLMADGRLFTRTGIGPHCPTGLDWSAVSLPDTGQSLSFVLKLTTALYVCIGASKLVSKCRCIIYHIHRVSKIPSKVVFVITSSNFHQV